MAKVMLCSNYVRKVNGTILDIETQQEEILDIVKQALKSGANEIYFNYKEEGPEEADPQKEQKSL